MSKKSAYEEALSKKMDEIPLPDEDASWQNMKDLLDKDNDRAVPFWFLKDYRVLGLLTMLLFGWGIWLMNSHHDAARFGDRKKVQASNDKTKIPESDFSPATQKLTTAIKSLGHRERNEDSIGHSQTLQEKVALDEQKEETTVMNTRNVPASRGSDLHMLQGKSFPAPAIQIVENSNHTRKLNKSKGLNQSDGLGTDKREARSAKNVKLPNNVRQNPGSPSIPAASNELHQDSTSLKQNPFYDIASNKEITLSVDSIAKRNQSSVDSIAKRNHSSVDSIAKRNQPSVDSAANTKQIVKLSKLSSRKFLLTAGLGVQQQIQVGGQQSIKYGYKAGSLASDYIPALWINFERKGKWFFQTGFVYSSPQLVKEFAFNRQTKSDALGSVTSTLRLKKTFYSQLPLSFNYYVKPNWSIGTGITGTWLHGAIAEKETSIKNTSSQTPLVMRQIVPINGFTDSFLYRSNSFFTLQTDYQWKRVSLGLKFSKDLQSYIRYTMPDGTITEDRNWGLQAVLRLRLWRKEFK